MEIERELELLRESWTETFDQLFVLYEVAREVSSVLDLDSVLDHIVNHAFMLLESDAAAIFLVDRETGNLVLKIIRDDQSSVSDKGAINIKMGEGIAGEVAKSGKPAIFPQDVDEKQFKHDAAAFSVKSPKNLICVPILLRGGGTIGVIEVINKKKGTFSTKDRDFLMAIANISALSIENARVYKEMKASEVYQSQLIENLPEGFVAVNNEGKITHINSCALKLLGFAGTKECIGKPYISILDAEQELAGHLKSAMEGGQTVKWKETSLKKTGRPVFLFTFVFKGNDNSILGAGAVIQDMVLKRS